jgi:hypothetical protein
MFDHTVRYLGFLKHVPLLPHVFDAYLKSVSYFNGSGIATVIDDIETEVLSWKNTESTLHKYGGLQFDVNGKEMGHVHGNGLLDVLFNRVVAAELIAQHEAKEHHVFKNSGWVSFYIRSEKDKADALNLLRRSYEMKTINSRS